MNSGFSLNMVTRKFREQNMISEGFSLAPTFTETKRHHSSRDTLQNSDCHTSFDFCPSLFRTRSKTLDNQFADKCGNPLSWFNSGTPNPLLFSCMLNSDAVLQKARGTLQFVTYGSTAKNFFLHTFSYS